MIIKPIEPHDYNTMNLGSYTMNLLLLLLMFNLIFILMITTSKVIRFLQQLYACMMIGICLAYNVVGIMFVRDPDTYANLNIEVLAIFGVLINVVTIAICVIVFQSKKGD